LILNLPIFAYFFVKEYKELFCTQKSYNQIIFSAKVLQKKPVTPQFMSRNSEETGKNEIQFDKLISYF